MDVGVIGVGTMGENHLRVYSGLRGVDSLYLFDVDHAAAERLACEHDATACPTLDALLARVDAVSICTPTPLHHPIAGAAISAGVHILVEKPLCATAAEARDLIAHIPDDLTVGVGHIERFNPIVPEIRAIVSRPLYVEFNRHNPASGRITDASVVEDLMIHDIDIAAHVLFTETPHPFTISGAGTPDVCTALFTAGTTPISLSASRKSSKKIRRIYIEEESFTIEGDFMAQEVSIYRKPDQYAAVNERYVQENIIETVLVNQVEPLKVELATFLDCARHGRPFPITPGQAATNLAICEEINASANGHSCD
ncbi:MAG: Gfo/Idh/MocA family oxidoreductase [Methanomicrobiales archaeon]